MPKQGISGSEDSSSENIWKDVSVINSHLNCIFDQDCLDAWRWPDEVAYLVSETFHNRNDVRYNAVGKLGDLETLKYLTGIFKVHGQ